jgi:hypothetical protein
MQARRYRCNCFVFLVVLAALIGQPAVVEAQTAVAAEADLANRHPDAGIWVAYRGNNSVADLQKPAIKGVMTYAPWNKLYLNEGTFDWSKLDNGLDLAINQAGKKSFVEVSVGYCPDLDWPAFMRAQIASRKQQNNKGCAPLQFWDPLYIGFYKAYIRALADYLAHFDATDARPNTTDILFVRAQPMAETMENLPDDYTNWQWQDFTPAPNGRRHQVDLTKELAYAYDQEIVLTFRQELQRAYGARGLAAPTPVAKAATYWDATPNRDLFVNQGIWFDKHNGAPNPQGWYYDMIQKVRTGATRAATESGNHWPDALVGQYTYWEVLAALHSGIEFIGLYGTNRTAPQLQPKGPVGFVENSEALAFGERYAGHLRNPARSPGAWVALRGGYPEERWSNNLHQVRIWTNYEFLLTQYRPQDSVPLFGVANSGNEEDTIPVATRNHAQPWPDEVTLCANRYAAAECDYLHNQPSILLGQNNGRFQYTYAPSDLGQVASCSSDLFCDNPASMTRQERMLWARRTDMQSGRNVMRFALNDQFATTLNGRAVVRVVYLDQGNGQWELRYDGADAAEQSAIVIRKQNSNRWKEVLVKLNDVRFANRQEGGTDLTLDNMGDDDDTFHLIEVSRPAPTYKNQLYLPLIAKR